MSHPTAIDLSPSLLAAFEVPGIAERWAAVQEQVHPIFAALAERIAAAAAERFPRQWPLYELSYKSQRFVNRGRQARAPIDEYHLAIDRVPRGSGIYVAISGAERAVLVGLQLWGARKPDLLAVWEQGRTVFAPLVTRIAQEGQARFTRAAGADRRSQQFSRPALPAASPSEQMEAPQPRTQQTWLDAYLNSRSASYLWAGFVYPLDAAPGLLPTLADHLVEDVLALLPLNEALMEQAEDLSPSPVARLWESRAAFVAQQALPPADEIVATIARHGFTYPESVLRAYHVALQTRPLVMLPGISGTGKTRLTRLYADAVHRIAPGQDNPFYLLIAVQPDWHNARDLLGFYNSLSGVYHPTPFLRFLLRAAADPAALYFVCLDELNLARPEYYLAPILSALETSERLIDLGIPADSAPASDGTTIGNPLRLPLNLRISGTLNVDESTHSLSDKLLDRANVIELTDVDLAGFRTRYPGPIDEHVWQTIVAVHTILARAGQPFGYRTLGEMLRFIEQARGVLPTLAALDLQIKQKVLPKLRGEDSPRLRGALAALLALLLGLPSPPSDDPGDDQTQAAPFPQSAEKVVRMRRRLITDGFTDFYG